MLRGEISKGDYDHVVAFLRAHHPFLQRFYLNSPGGDADEALRIGRIFRKYLLQTGGDWEFSDRDGVILNCASACALIWFGGVDRLGKVGIHRPRIGDPMFRGLSPPEASTAYRQVLGRIAAYLEEMEVPKSIIELMIGTGSSDLRPVDGNDDGVDRPPSIAEWEDASCGPGSSAKDQVRLFMKTNGRQGDTMRSLLCVNRLLNNHRDRLARP